MKFNSKNLLITGGAGFIGSNFIKYLFQKFDDINIINLDLLTYAGDTKNLDFINNKHNYNFITGDICDKNLLEDIFKEYKIDGVINFAAETHVDNSITNPDVFVKTNVNGTFNLLNIAYKYWMNGPFNIKNEFNMARFHQISTDEVYGSITNGSFTESSNYSPNSPYSASKAGADMLVRSFNKTYGLNTCISICSNNFGPNQNLEKFIPKVINCLVNNKDIPVYGNGNNVRDWIYVTDHCKAIELIFNKSKSGEIFNIAGNNELTNLDLINIIYQIINKSKKIHKKITFVKDRYGHDKRYSLDISKIGMDIGWKPSNNFQFNLMQLVNSYLNE